MFKIYISIVILSLFVGCGGSPTNTGGINISTNSGIKELNSTLSLYKIKEKIGDDFYNFELSKDEKYAFVISKNKIDHNSSLGIWDISINEPKLKYSIDKTGYINHIFSLGNNKLIYVERDFENLTCDVYSFDYVLGLSLDVAIITPVEHYAGENISDKYEFVDTALIDEDKEKLRIGNSIIDYTDLRNLSIHRPKILELRYYNIDRNGDELEINAYFDTSDFAGISSSRWVLISPTGKIYHRSGLSSHPQYDYISMDIDLDHDSFDYDGLYTVEVSIVDLDGLRSETSRDKIMLDIPSK